MFYKTVVLTISGESREILEILEMLEILSEQVHF